jgi:hypothetical protein
VLSTLAVVLGIVVLLCSQWPLGDAPAIARAASETVASTAQVLEIGTSDTGLLSGPQSERQIVAREKELGTPASVAGPAAGSHIFGVITNCRGQAIAGARVTHSESRVPLVAWSQSDGSFEATLHWKSGRVTPTLHVVADGYRAKTIRLSSSRTALLSNEARLRVDAVLDDGAVIVGRVLCGVKPVEKARVVVSSASTEAGSLPPVFTRPSGEFEVNVPTGQRYAVVVSHGVYGSARVVGVLAAQTSGDERRDIQLLPTTTLRSRFTYPSGKPIADLRVLVSQEQASGSGSGATAAGATTDASGYVELLGLAAGRYRFRLPELMSDSLARSIPSQRTDHPNADVVISCCRVSVRHADNESWDLRVMSASDVRWQEVVTHGGRASFTADAMDLTQRVAPAMRRLLPYRSSWVLLSGSNRVAFDVLDAAYADEQLVGLGH